MGVFDFFKGVVDQSTEIDQLKETNNGLTETNANLTEENKNLKEQLEYTKSLVNKDVQELLELEKSKKEEISKLDKEITKFKRRNKETRDNIDKQLNEKTKELKRLKSELVDVSEQVMYESVGLYEPRYEFSNSTTYKAKLDEIRSKQKMMIKAEEAGVIFQPIMFDNSISKGKSIQKKNIKQLLRAFNGETEASINKVKVGNIDLIERKINQSFKQLNKLNEGNGVKITVEYLDSKLDEAHVALDYAVKKEEEKEILREQKQREREEKALAREIAKEKAKYEKEETHYTNAKEALQEKLAKETDQNEIESLKAELENLQQKLAEIEENKAKIQDREANPTAGYVYIISNIGSFGKNIYKIGVTRRLDSMDRINELGSASVPFKFDVHALIFSDDAYKLETELHNHFDKERVNMVNKRKEYFNISMDEIKEVLNQHKELTVEFHEVPEAIEYRDTQLIKQKQ